MKRLVALWLSLSAFNYGAILADEKSHHWQCAPLYHSSRKTASMCAALAMLPLAGTVIAIFATGFLENGWTLDPVDKCAEKH